jgi:hypothetical protein
MRLFSLTRRIASSPLTGIVWLLAVLTAASMVFALLCVLMAVGYKLVK